MKYDCIIIGSGISGLAAALFLAQQGKRIAVVEQASFIAPLVKRFKRDEVWCDPGFHYTGGFHPTGTLSILIRYLGLDDKIKIIPMDPDCFDTLTMDEEKEFNIPYGFDHLQDYLCDRFPTSAHSVKEYVRTVQHINRETYFTNLSLPCEYIAHDIDRYKSLREFFIASHAEEALIKLLGSYGHFLYGVSEDEIPLHIHAYIMGSFYQSASMIASGGDGLVDAFKIRLYEEKVDFFLKQKITAVLIDDFRKVKGVKTEDGTILECDSCICTIHPQLLSDILPREKLKPAFFNRLKQFENTSAAFVVFLRVDRIPTKLQKANYYRFSSGCDNAKSAIAFMSPNKEAEINGRRSLTVIRPCGGDLFRHYLHANTMKRDASYFELKEQIAEETTEALYVNFPELRGNAQVVAVATPATYFKYTNTIDGSIYGIKQSIHRSPLGPLTPIHNFYLAGQSIIPGVMGAIVSSLQAVTNVIKTEQLWSGIQRCL